MEQWKDIKGYDGLYQVSNLGRVKSLKRKVWNGKKYYTIPEKPLKLGFNGRYYHVRLSKAGAVKIYVVHKLVAEAFIPNPNNHPVINHKDENKTNNNVDNLEWCSIKYNCNYGNRNNTLRKKIYQYDLQGNFIKEWCGMRVASRELNICYSSIYKCCSKKVNIAGGYVWSYANK